MTLPVANLAARLVCGVLPLVAMTAGAADEPSKDGVEFFEKNVRPLLVENCYECHDGSKGAAVKSGLRLDSREGVLRGGDSGKPPLVAGDAENSRLIKAVRRTEADLKMPPKHSLSDQQVATLVTWVNLGAPDPRTSATATTVKKASELWAFHKPVDPALPDVKHPDWVRTPVDRFILRELEKHDLKPSPEADRRTLIRRATYDLLGLPPTAEEVDAFVSDPSPDAYEKLVDRLLASPHYGERWGRYWLDLARYSDTKGYAYDREERRFVHAHAYRDWVIRAFNEDMPYDRFLLLQIAADQLGPADRARLPEDLAASGFLTVGRRFLGVVHDVIDDRIDTLMRTTQALTVACARCHDHKFDPIPTSDYYSLYGVFAGSTERSVRLDTTPDTSKAAQEYEKGLRQRQQKLLAKFERKKESLVTGVREHVAQYLAAVPEAGKLHDELFYENLAPDELNPVIVRQWQQYLFDRSKHFDPIWAPWSALAALPANEWAAKAPETVKALLADAAHPLNGRVAAALKASPTPASMADVAKLYSKLLQDVYAEWLAAAKDPEAAALSDPEAEALRQVLYGPDSPTRVPEGSIADIEWFFDEGTRVELQKLQADIDRFNIDTPAAPPYALLLVDKPEQVNPRILLRGNPTNKGVEVQRHFLTAIAGTNASAFTNGSGRLELARAIASKENPLTARVMVNRIWQDRFGRGLVPTPSDFGSRAEACSHPELLDWLAVRFMEGAWSVKKMHRLMMLSATYRQSSESNGAGNAADPDNKLLWRMNRGRLDFEAMRDSLLAASGELDPTMGGRPVTLQDKRRTVYATVDRQFLAGVFRVFDFANPDLHIPQRAATTVPQQALFFMNSPFVTDRAKALAARPDVKGAADEAERVQRLYRLVYQRPATEHQVAAARAFIHKASDVPVVKAGPVVPSQWKYGFGAYDASADRLTGFTELPRFTGEAWQGGDAWPDATLGWVRLTAIGGHAGNDLAHAAVRRWTAPADMTVRIEGTVRHELPQGNGVAARLVSSRGGTLGRWTLFSSSAETRFEPVEVKQGDTLDFVVDHNGDLNNDMFTWAPTITRIGSGAGVVVNWDAKREFGGPEPTPPSPLEPWSAYAHVLLLSNEFMFVD